jgi:hypothetical protein
MSRGVLIHRMWDLPPDPAATLTPELRSHLVTSRPLIRISEHNLGLPTASGKRLKADRCWR